MAEWLKAWVCKTFERKFRIGSNPILLFIGVVAQLVRAPDCHSGGCGFKPRQFRSITENIMKILQLERLHGAYSPLAQLVRALL